MSLSDSIANDYLVFDDFETVTVESHTAGDLVVVKVFGAQRKEVTKQQVSMLGNVGVETDSMMFSLPIRNMKGLRLKQGDKIIDGTDREWFVVYLTESTLGTRYKAFCNQGR